MSREHISGSLLGCAVGDAIGLPYEGLTRRRAARVLGPPDRHRLLPGRGMVSDDTEHACMVARALIASGGDARRFRHHLAAQLRWWLLALPAGVGLATLRAGLRLWLGFGPERSGVYSAGNGPAMRAPILGAAIDDAALLCRLVRASTRITHTDPRAEQGALAVALAARAARDGLADCTRRFRHLTSGALEGGTELARLLAAAERSALAGEATTTFADSLGLSRGVSGFVDHTVPVAVHAWLAHGDDFRSAVTAVVGCGGDADTTAAIVGGITGAGVGRSGIPGEWIDGLWDWPRSVAWIERLAEQLAESVSSGQAQRPLGLPPGAVLPRNLLFLAVVLLHGLRRALPPY